MQYTWQLARGFALVLVPVYFVKHSVSCYIHIIINYIHVQIYYIPLPVVASMMHCPSYESVTRTHLLAHRQQHPWDPTQRHLISGPQVFFQQLSVDGVVPNYHEA